MSDLKPFHFAGADGKTHQIPDVRVLSARQLQAASQGDFDTLEQALVDNGAGQAAVDALLDMPLHQLNDVIERWVAGDEEGKLSEPSPSSTSTATPSKPTSRSGGSRSKR